jgi:hypothetical protein
MRPSGQAVIPYQVFAGLMTASPQEVLIPDGYDLVIESIFVRQVTSGVVGHLYLLPVADGVVLWQGVVYGTVDQPTTAIAVEVYIVCPAGTGLRLATTGELLQVQLSGSLVAPAAAALLPS